MSDLKRTIEENDDVIQRRARQRACYAKNKNKWAKRDYQPSKSDKVLANYKCEFEPFTKVWFTEAGNCISKHGPVRDVYVISKAVFDPREVPTGLGVLFISPHLEDRPTYASSNAKVKHVYSFDKDGNLTDGSDNDELLEMFGSQHLAPEDLPGVFLIRSPDSLPELSNESANLIQICGYYITPEMVQELKRIVKPDIGCVQLGVKDESFQ